MPRITIILAALFFLFGCRTTLERRAWEVVGAEHDNQEELHKFLEHYKQLGNRDKYLAACFLVANMPNKYSSAAKFPYRIYDLKVVKADSLILSLDYSFALRDSLEYLCKYSFEEFCEYVLPYRIANEPLSYYWKWDISRWLTIEKGDNISTLARSVNKQIDVNTEPEAWGNPLLGYEATISGKFGKCDDRAILTVMAMRSVGIPSAFDFIPAWGSNNNGHSVCSIILPNKSILVFQGKNDDGEDVFLSQKAPKIYRHIYSLQSTFASENLPSLFSNLDLIDVTTQHDVGFRNVTLPISESNSYKAICLSVFSPERWVPVTYTKYCRKHSVFLAIGNGTNTSGYPPAKGENIGNGILYLPVWYDNGTIYPAAAPFIVSENGVQKISCSNETESIILSRKYPRFNRLFKFADQMVGGIFEGANKPDFSDAVSLYYVTETPLSRLQRIRIPFSKFYRFVRFRKPKGIFSLGEFRFYDTVGTLIGGTLIADPAIEKESDLFKICDDDPLTYYEVSGGLDLWAGFSFGRSVRIAEIEFCPRNDDNEIFPGDVYELFYWKDEWKSLGEKMATDFVLKYDSVPKGALLWLRNKTKGKEERPFTYENNKQIWW